MPASSQVGSEIFLQSKYLALGINSSGTLGTRATAPVGFTTDAADGYIRLGIVGDPDGFGSGAAQTRDGVLLGTPVESFVIGYDKSGTNYIKTNSERDGVSQIQGGVATNTSSAGVESASWAGTTTEGVAVKQVFALADDAKYVRVDVTLTNTTGGDISNLRYMRSVDADQGSSFETINKIVEQGHDGANGALVAAYTTANTNPLFYYTQDDRAIVSTYGFENRNPYASQAYDAPQAEGLTVKADQAININFSVGKLGAGQSTTLTYYMGITNDLAATVHAIDAGGVASPPAPTPTPTPVPNTAPTAVDDAATVKAGESVKGHVLANDSDANGDSLKASLISGPAHGTLTLSANGDYSYTPKTGFSGADSFTYAASDGKAASNATVALTVTPPPNVAPVAVDDAAGTVGTHVVTGNVLANDADANCDVLTATVGTGPAHGTLSLGADGAFSYVADSGFSGTDSFTYAASDGKAASAATVTITVDAPPPPPPPPPSPPPPPPPPIVLDPDGRAATIDGSSAESQSLTGTDARETFYFDNTHATGNDVVHGFGHDDVLTTAAKLYDPNNDGWLGLFGAAQGLDATGTGDQVALDGVVRLRFMGTDADSHFVYADGDMRPRLAKESKLGDDLLKGDSRDHKAQTFFFDTELGLDLGHDKISNFGRKDILVTTKALALDATGHAATGADGSFDLGTADATHLGDVTVSGLKGVAIDGLEFDGSVTNHGTEYFVYSLADTSVGVASLHFN